MIVTLMGGQSARYPTIASAIEAAPKGSVVQICPGTYDDEVIVERAIEIHGSGPEQTVWGAPEGTALTIDASDVVVRDLTFSGGTGSLLPGYQVSCGGAMQIWQDPEFTRAITLENLEFVANQATLGGALFIDGSENTDSVPLVTMQGCTFSENTAEQFGGAVFSYGRFHISNTTIIDNSAGISGGGVIINFGCQSADQCTITDSIVERNTASEGMFVGGGGLWLGDFEGGAAGVTVSNSDFGFGFADENLPQDVFTVFNVVPQSYGAYGDAISFSCDEGMCTEP